MQVSAQQQEAFNDQEQKWWKKNGFMMETWTPSHKETLLQCLVLTQTCGPRSYFWRSCIGKQQSYQRVKNQVTAEKKSHIHDYEALKLELSIYRMVLYFWIFLAGSLIYDIKPSKIPKWKKKTCRDWCLMGATPHSYCHPSRSNFGRTFVFCGDSLASRCDASMDSRSSRSCDQRLLGV